MKIEGKGKGGCDKPTRREALHAVALGGAERAKQQAPEVHERSQRFDHITEHPRVSKVEHVSELRGDLAVRDEDPAGIERHLEQVLQLESRPKLGARLD